jgi:transposase
VPALPSSVIEPVWDQFAVLIPEHIDTHPLGCHNPRIPDRTVFDKLVQVLVLGASYERIADSSCSATTIRNRRDEWIAAGVFTQLEQLCLEAYDKSVGLDLSEVIVDGCIVKAPCGGEAAGRSPVDRGKQGTKRSLLVEATGIPLGCVIAGAHRNDSPLLRPRWSISAGSIRAWASVCPTTSQCISTPATTRPRPVTCSTNSAAMV